ncbi:TPA: hypothetical protein TU158_001843 [Streptococcus equi subsp. zooepidemicus]|nr:hypothetical protein [Streptococcus equi subsp. zooepidemicus]
MRLDETLYTIFSYESSINRPEKERWTKTSPLEQFGNYIEWSGNPTEDTDTPLTLEEYADKCKEYLRFGKEVDEVLYGKMDAINQVCICQTPPLLKAAGFENKPMLYTQKHLLDAIHPKDDENYHWHGLSVAQIKRLPELLETPVMLCDSPARKDVMLAVLCTVDSDKLPLIVAIKPDGKGNYKLQEIETNFILSVYGKNNFTKYFDERITPEKIIYINIKQAHKLEALAELQLLRCHPKVYELDNVIIRKPQCIVNLEKSENVKPSLNNEVSSMREASKELSESSIATFTKDTNKEQEDNR